MSITEDQSLVSDIPMSHNEKNLDSMSIASSSVTSGNKKKFQLLRDKNNKVKDYWKKKVKGSAQNTQKHKSMNSGIQEDTITENGNSNNQKAAGVLQSSFSDNSIRTHQSD